VGISAPANYGPDYQADFEAIYSDLADTFGTGLVPNILGPLVAAAETDGLAGIQRFMQGDGIHPNARGVALIVEVMGPELLTVLNLAP